MRKILLLHGAGVEQREPAHEATMTAAGPEAMLREHAAACGFDFEIFYASSEADAVERLSRIAEDGVEGVMINPDFSPGHQKWNLSCGERKTLAIFPV